MKKIIIIFIMLISIALVGAGASYVYIQRLQTINKGDNYLIIKEESSLENLAREMESKSIIKSKDVFLMYAKLNKFNGNIKSSKLIIKQGTSYKELISKLRSGESDFSIVTIPEGFTLYQIGERLEKYTKLKKENLLEKNISDLSSNNIVSKKPNTYYDLEGFLYPDTYYIPTDANEEDIIKLMFGRFKSVMSDKYVNRAKELGLDINEVITIASLIEKEAANDSERSKIAGVIYNRIEKGMPLQIDAAVIYAHTKGKKIMEKVTYKDLEIQDLYNTYKYKGLPPGPIAAPGKASIEAVLYPEEHDYLYYVANGNAHVFSKTYAEHLNNVRKYIK